MANHEPLTAAKVAAIQADIALGMMTHMQIGVKHKIHFTSVSKIKRGIIGKKAAAELAAQTKPPVPMPETTALTTTNGNGHPPGSKYAAQYDQVRELVAQGLTSRAVSEKLGIPYSAVQYVRYQIPKQKRFTSIEDGENNGSNGLNKNIAIGIAYAETERFITAIAERLGLSPDLLRRELSGLLGRSPLR